MLNLSSVSPSQTAISETRKLTIGKKVTHPDVTFRACTKLLAVSPTALASGTKTFLYS